MENNNMGFLDGKESARIDYLTGDLNRRGMYAYFDELDDDEDINVMFLDIDNFKSVNDTYGHAMGDKLLVEVSRTIRKRIGSSKLVRFAGDEFLVMPLPGMPERAVVGMAESIINSVNDINISLEIRSIISFSIGIVMGQKKSMGLDNIMPKCDVAMYEAKKRGKNGYVLYSSIEDLFERKQLVDKEKTQALHNGHFEVQYIPVMNLSNSALVATRAYIVWNRKDEVWKEEVFREFLEENGFVVELEKYVFAKICQMLKAAKGHEVENVPVIFPISGVNINRVHFLEEIMSEVTSYGLSPEKFIIQLDNVSKRFDTRRLKYFFQNLREAGFGTSVRAFGDEGVSITVMKDLELDYVCLGKEIVDGLIQNKRENMFVKNILALIDDLNFEPLADGISNAIQIRYLTSFGCSMGSGPIISESLKEWEYRDYAEMNRVDSNGSIKFEFRNNLFDTTGKYCGKYCGKSKPQFLYDKALGKEVLFLPGGTQLVNVVELPVEMISAGNYTIIIRFRTTDFNEWTSLLYILYEDGFMSFMPYGWTGLSMYRIKEDLDENGWHDVLGKKIDREWHTVVLTFNQKLMTAQLYMDGMLLGLKDNVYVLKVAKSVVLGGDIYANSFQGYVDYVQYYDYVLSKQEIEQRFSKRE